MDLNLGIMSNPIFLIIQREFLSRVRKKTFLLVTLIGPLAFAALMIVPGLLATMPEDSKQIIVLDEPTLLLPHEGKEQYTLEYLDPRENDLELAKELLRDSQYDALLYIPSGENWDPDFIKNNILLFGKEDPILGMTRSKIAFVGIGHQNCDLHKRFPLVDRRTISRERTPTQQECA